MPHVFTVFAGGIATCFYALLFRFGFYNNFRGGGYEYDCSCRDDLLLNHKLLFNFNMATMNICSNQCLVLILGCRQSWCQRDERSTISDGNWTTDPRSPVVRSRHRRPCRAMGQVNVARSVRRLQRHCTCTETGCSKVDREAFAPNGQQKRNFRRMRAMMRPTDVTCDRSVAVANAWLLLHLSRHPCVSMVERLDTFLAIAYDNDENSAEHYLFEHVNNAITILKGSRVCEANKQFLLQ